MKPEGKKLLFHLLINSAVLITLYFLIPSLVNFSYMPHIYLIVGAGLALYYVIYNRGFVGKNATPDMLPNSMTPVQKQAYIEESKKRFRDSRWVLTVIVPIILTFFADMLYLFIFPYIEEMFT